MTKTSDPRTFSSSLTRVSPLRQLSTVARPSDDFGARPHPVVEVDDHLLRAFDNVVVGDDVSLVVVDEAGAFALLQRHVPFRQLEARNLRQIRGGGDALHLDVDDRRRDCIVQRGQGVGIFVERGIDLERRRSHDHSGRVGRSRKRLPGQRCGERSKGDQPGADHRQCGHRQRADTARRLARMRRRLVGR